MEKQRTGRIVRSISGFYDVQTGDGVITCRARGILRKENCTPLTGDMVNITVERGKGMVEKVLPRRNCFVRPAVANIDALVVFAANVNPVTEPFLIDRVAAIAGDQDVPVYLCVNKCDLDPAVDLVHIYRNAGFPVICTSAETACSCGAFYLAEYVPLESWVMKKNPENYDKDNVYIDTIRYIYNQEELISGPEMVRRGEIDQATISSDILDSWLSDDTTKDMVSMERPETGKSYFYIFNFLPYAHEFSNWNVTGVDAQYEPDNWAKAVNSTNFRKAFLYAINPSVTLAVTAPEGYDNYKLHTITPPSFCANSQGVDYTECGDLANLSDFFDEAKAKEYRDAAVEELTAAGATFPIKVQYPYNPAVVDWDKQCQVFKQQVEGVLNDGFDFINIIITQGPSDNFLNAVRRVGAYELMSYYWGADYSDPETEVYPFYQEAGDRGTCYAFLRTGVEDGIITGETAEYVMTYMDLVKKAKAITEDLDARYEAFANAEAYLIQNALVVPLGLPVPPYIATRLNLWEGQYAPTGLSTNRLKGVHILDHYVSMEEYNANRDAR